MTPLEMQAAAQADADRFYGNAPVMPWQPGMGDGEVDGEPAASRWPWALALAVLVALVAAAAFALRGYVDDLTTAPPPVDALDAPARASASPTGDPDEDLIDEPAPAPRPAPTAMAPGSTRFAITRQRREWRIEAHGASRLLVAQKLAEATGSTLRGDVALLAGTRPLDLQWQGRGALQAWQAVLGQELSFLTQCSAARCRVWVLQAGPGHDIALHLPPPRAVIPLPSVDPIGTTAAAPSPPQSDSADPRVAAHHD